MEKVSQNRLEKHVVWLLLIFLIAAGSFLRLWNLGRTSLWVDETNALFAARSWVENGTLAFPSGFIYTRAPLYTYLTGLFFKCFGIGEVATRLTAALFGILCIWMSYVFAKKLFDTKVGLATAFLTAFSHFEVGWSRTAKMYTLLQFLSLVMLYAFVRGFEAEADRTIGKERSSPLGCFLKKWHISPVWLAICGVVFIYACFWVQYLVLFVPVGILLYCVTLAVMRFLTTDGKERIINKYAMVSVLGMGTVLLIGILLPNVRHQAHYFITYTPAWAEGGSSAQNRQFLFEFLISPQRFPLAAFFFIGSILTLTRRKKLGWLGWCIFFAAFFSLSFVFTHRVPTYLFFVYPLFLATAAFGFVTFVEQEIAVLNQNRQLAKFWIKAGLVAATCSVFLVSPWLRITLHIPFLPDGITNMAVTPEEWREASKSVLDQKRPNDLVITSLPQVAMVYGLKSDYCLNESDLALTKIEQIVTKDGRLADVYSGVVCIQTLDELKHLIQMHPRGWLAVSQFHIENENYIPKAVKEFIETRLSTAVKTQNGTVLIYHWDDRSGG